MVLNLTNGQFDQTQYYFNPKGKTMSFLGTLSPPSSSGDSMDIPMTSPLMSPNQLLYNVEQCILEDQDDQLMPYLKILEQPVEKFRFRYKSEMSGTHGSLTGMCSDKMRKCTYPTVQLHNYMGPVYIRCALYQINNSEPHPHRLVVRIDNKDKEKDDPHDMAVSDESNFVAVFHGMGIIHTAKKNLVHELYSKKKFYYKEELARKGHIRLLTKHEEAELRNQAEREAKNINLNSVRLGFQAFRKEQGAMIPVCNVVYSHGINNLKSALTGELKIVRMDYTTTSCVGGQEIFILVEKVVKNNIKIRFFECDEDDNEIWSDYGKFSHIDVHHQYAIVFKAPPYRDLNIEDTRTVCIELFRPSDGARSEPRQFKYKPSEKIGRKRQRFSESLSSGELPATINNLSSLGSSLGSLTFSGGPLDTDLFRKMENVDSDEFNALCKEMFPGYQELFDMNESVPVPTTINMGLTTDGPSKPSTSFASDPIFNSDTTLLAKKVVSELGALLKRTSSKKDPDLVESIVQKLFNIRTTNGNNALHTSIMCEQYSELQYILVLLSKMKHLGIVDLTNDNQEAALHIAVNINNPTVVTLLLSVGANPNCANKQGNTPLHCAIELDQLETCEGLITKETINKENYDGFTPLHLAILKKNLSYVEKLIQNKANVRHKHPANGNTSLHMAIQEQSTEIVNYLLNNTEAHIDQENFNKHTPLHQAKILSKDNSDSAALEIYRLLTEYIQERGYENLMIKSEPEDDDTCSESDELNIKSEPASPSSEAMEVEGENLQFSPECINNLSRVLDSTDTLKKLSKDLGFSSGGLQVTTKLLLNFVNVTEIPMFRVRDLLCVYGVEDAVNIINNFMSDSRQ